MKMLSYASNDVRALLGKLPTNAALCPFSCCCSITFLNQVGLQGRLSHEMLLAVLCLPIADVAKGFCARPPFALGLEDI